MPIGTIVRESQLKLSTALVRVPPQAEVSSALEVRKSG